MDSLEELEALFQRDKAVSRSYTDLFTSSAKVRLRMLSDDVKIPVSFFPEDIQWEDFMRPLYALVCLDDNDGKIMERISSEVFQEFQDNRLAREEDYETDADQLNEEGEGRDFRSLFPPSDVSDILRLIRFTHIGIQKSYDGKGVSLSICAQVAWDMEHELAIDFRDGVEFKWISQPGAGC